MDIGFRRLPHDARRTLWRALQPKKAAEFKALRRNTTNEYTLRSFDKYQCIFVHIPKAAGVSVLNSLFGNLGGGHKRLTDYQLIYDARTFDRYYKFTFVRNPWDRLYSAFNFLKSGGMNADDHDWAVQHLAEFDDFNDFVCQWLSIKNAYQGIHFIPQVEFLRNCKGIIDIDFIGRFENLENDLITISDSLGIKEVTISHKNKTRGIAESYVTAYSEEARRVAAEVYKTDIEVFGYQFGEP